MLGSRSRPRPLYVSSLNFAQPRPERAFAFKSSTTLAIGLALYVLAVGVLVFSAEVPPLTDFPNHFARLWMLGGPISRPPLSHFYASAWGRASTNIGADVLTIALSHVLPMMWAGKLVVLIALVGPPLAGMRLNQVAFGRTHWWQAVFLVFTWTTTALWGFLSYQLGLTLALLAASFEPRLRGRLWLGMIARLGFAALTLICHPFSLLFYSALIAAFAVGPDATRLRPSALPRLAINIVGLAAIVLVAVVVLYTLAPTPPGAHGSGKLVMWDLSPKAMAAAWLSPFLSYNRLVDFAFIAPVFGAIAWLLRRGGFQIHVGLLIAGFGLTVLAAVMPLSIGDAWWLNRRVPLMAVLAMTAAVLPKATLSSATRGLLLGGLAALFLARTAWIGAIWIQREADIQSVEQMLTLVPSGASLMSVEVRPAHWRTSPIGRYLVGTSGTKPEPTLRHLAALAVIQRQAFIPTLFTVPGQQPLKVLAPWDRFSVQSSVIPDMHVLDRPAPQQALIGDPYLKDWRRHFDYVLVLGVDEADAEGPLHLPPYLTPLAHSRYALLLRNSH